MLPRRATIRDVAKKAEVSVSTASKAFNNKQEVAEETRLRVLRVAADLHFTPNGLIRSLQRGHSNTIGVCTWPVNILPAYDGITMLVLKGIADGVTATHHDLLLYAEYLGKTKLPLVTIFLDNRVDGIICGPHVLTEEGLAQVAAAGLPTVILYNDQVPTELGAVTIDNISGVVATVEHLVSLGHRRIAFHAAGDTFDYHKRCEGYRKGLERFGVAFDPALCITSTDFTPQIAAVCTRLLSLTDPPTALIAGDDSLAFQWLDELSLREVRVPEDISVVGFDDSPRASLPPGLTTVRQDAVRVGEAAVELVDRLIKGEAVPERQIQFPVELVIRKTTGGVPQHPRIPKERRRPA